MNGITKVLVVAMLVFMAIPAMAFVPTIPSSVETVGVGLTDGQITSDNAAYAYTRTVADAAGDFEPQHVYSAVEFGAAEDGSTAGEDGTGGEVANAMSTSTPSTAGITRQYISQTGTASVSTAPAAVADGEHPTETPVVTAKMTTSNLAWISGDLTSFTASPATWGTVGGNYIDPAYGTVSGCGNVWLYENDPTETITVTANSDTTKGPISTLVDAYAGTATSASLTAYPGITFRNGESTNVPAEVLMSGYAEKFGGYDDADVGGAIGVSANGGSIGINFGSGTVTQGWNSASGEPFNWPVTSSGNINPGSI